MRVPVLVWVGGLVLYCATVAPTVLWGDDAELQRIVVTGEHRTLGQSGEASHLLWLGLTRFFVGMTGWLPLDQAGRANLVSALSGAAALPFVYSAAYELALALRHDARRARIAGVAAATALALSHTFWLLAARPDVYALQTALLCAATWAVVRWRRAQTGIERAALLGIAALVVGAALLNHVMILASLPGLAALAIASPAERRRALVVPALAALAVGVALLGLGAARGVPVLSLARSVAAYRPQLPLARDAALLVGYLVYQFPLALPLAVAGVVVTWRRDRRLLGALALLYAANVFLMLFRFHPAMYVRDQYIFFLPSYVPIALLIGIGVASALPTLAARFGPRLAPLTLACAIAAPLVIYPLASVTVGALATRLAPARRLPGRDPVGYYLLPAKTGYSGARRFAADAFSALTPGAVVVSDWLPYQTLLYVQRVEGQRPDVQLEMINAGNGAQVSFLLDLARRAPTRALYLADDSPLPYYEIDDIRRCFTVAPQPPIFRLTYRGNCD